MSTYALIVISGIAGTFIGGLIGLAGSIIASRIQARSSAEQQLLTTRLNAYAEFSVHVESMQLEIDRAIAEKRMVDHDVVEELFTKIETSRAHIDFVGSLPVRIWAYRFRIALERTLVEIAESTELLDLPRTRSKVHEARHEFIRRAREESTARGRAIERQSTSEDSAKAHFAWLDTPPTEEALEAIALTVDLIRRSS